MRIAITGSSGLIGTALRESYQRDGHEIVRLVRHEPRTAAELSLAQVMRDPAPLDGTDVLINLAGAGLGDRRWTRRYRDLILRSRVETTRTLSTAIARLAAPPKVMLSISGIRVYGIERGDEALTESSPLMRDGLLAQTAQEWELATAAAGDAGVRVCLLRLGLVLSRRGGILPPMLRMTRLGFSPYVGSGREYLSHLSLTDTVRAMRFLAEDDPGAAGPYNVSSPQPVPNKNLMRTLSRVTGARLLLRVPRPALRIALGPMANEIFGGLRVVPHRLTEAGFRFAQPDPESVLRAALAD